VPGVRQELGIRDKVLECKTWIHFWVSLETGGLILKYWISGISISGMETLCNLKVLSEFIALDQGIDNYG